MTRLTTTIQDAVDCLKQGGLVAIPTETVYGLAADAHNPQAIGALFQAKGRPANHPVIVHVENAEKALDFVQSFPLSAMALAKAFWPGPLTLVLPKASTVLDSITGGQDTVAIRVPNHPVTLALLKEFPGGVVAPSANRFGRVSPTRPEHVQAEEMTQIALILDGGPCTVGIESTIVGFDEAGLPVVLRPGVITPEDIAAVTGSAVQSKHQTLKENPDAPRVPGNLVSHYAPKTPMVMVPDIALAEKSMLNAYADGYLVGLLSHVPTANDSLKQQAVILPDDPLEYARLLYDSLRQLDKAGWDRLVVVEPPKNSAWLGVYNRLQRASSQPQAITRESIIAG